MTPERHIHDILIRNKYQHDEVRTDPLIIFRDDNTPPVVRREPPRFQAVQRPVRRPKRAAMKPIYDPAPIVAEAITPPAEENIPESDREKQEFFWNTISKFEWKNRSDGVVNGYIVKRTFDNMSLPRKVIFRAIYLEKIDALMNIVKHDGMFDRLRLINKLSEQLTILSHVVAMGKEQYESIDMEILQYFVSEDECQSLDRHLPPELQY